MEFKNRFTEFHGQTVILCGVNDHITSFGWPRLNGDVIKSAISDINIKPQCQVSSDHFQVVHISELNSINEFNILCDSQQSNAQIIKHQALFNLIVIKHGSKNHKHHCSASVQRRSDSSAQPLISATHVHCQVKPAIECNHYCK